mmetsp:Transcript_33251/g.53407  ORF Transcript_33251/g.53407 Transcript_33251/m.53407 type:complete len:236 (+) Transcript_33251:506-1213(+)
MMSAPIFCSVFSRESRISGIFSASLSRVVPPPATMPSSTADLVAQRASSTRSFFSLSSDSVVAPTSTTATPPASRAIRSLSLSNSYVDALDPFVFSSATSFSICLIRAFTSSLVDPSPTIVVTSLATSTDAVFPRMSTVAFSRVRPISSLITCPPVRMAISSRYELLRSPNPGAFTAHTFRPPRSLLSTRVDNTSWSISSAIMRRGHPPLTVSSRIPIISRAELIFLSTSKRRAF